MKSLRQLYKIGFGPSSSHTMGPATAAEQFKNDNPNCQYKATLYGSLSATGKGHLTDEILRKVLGDVEIVFDNDTKVDHPVAMQFEAIKEGVVVQKRLCYSIGGGDILWHGEKAKEYAEVYPHNSFEEIKAYCEEKNIELWQYCIQFEGEEIVDYMLTVWQTMKSCIAEGLNAEGILPGGLEVVRRAKILSVPKVGESIQTMDNRNVASYAFAVSEQNACGNIVVTAPTCGSAGVMPASLNFAQTVHGYTDLEIAKALLTAGVIGNLVKQNASISGAKCGCQAEIGTACSMASGALSQLKGHTLSQIECSAEIALEHHLGLTCDPVNGLVQIPCIERNAVAAMRAINASTLGEILTASRKISLDTVIETMYQTGKDLDNSYRETALGGLAKHYK